MERTGRKPEGGLNLCPPFIVPGNEHDLDSVYRLNLASFTEAWSAEAVFSLFAHGYELLVARVADKAVGYILSQDVLDELHILQLAVEPAFRRQGLGLRLGQALLSSKGHLDRAYLEVRRSNHAARCLYARLGFIETGCRRHYYTADADGFREDAILMQRKLTSHDLSNL